MSIDQNLQGMPASPNEAVKNKIQRTIESNNGLFPTVFGAWGNVRLVNERDVGKLKEIPTYEVYLRNLLGKDIFDLIMKHSNAEKVEEYNRLVESFNRELEWNRRRKNVARIFELSEEVLKLFPKAR